MRRLPRALDAVELRVLGALMEKARTTPDLYPLTPNSLVAACNQRTAREPVTDFTEPEVHDALERLRDLVLVWRRDGARTERWTENLTEKLALPDSDAAVVALLLLRGPQTPGELRSRSDRIHTFISVREVDESLAHLAEEPDPLVVELARRPGQKETRWAHLLGDPPEDLAPAASGGAGAAGTPAPFRSPPTHGAPLPPAEADRLSRLEAEVAALRAEVEELRRRLPLP